MGTVLGVAPGSFSQWAYPASEEQASAQVASAEHASTYGDTNASFPASDASASVPASALPLPLAPAIPAAELPAEPPPLPAAPVSGSETTENGSPPEHAATRRRPAKTPAMRFMRPV